MFHIFYSTFKFVIKISIIHFRYRLKIPDTYLWCKYLYKSVWNHHYIPNNCYEWSEKFNDSRAARNFSRVLLYFTRIAYFHAYWRFCCIKKQSFYYFTHITYFHAYWLITYKKNTNIICTCRYMKKKKKKKIKMYHTQYKNKIIYCNE